MEVLSNGTLVFGLCVIAAYGFYHLYLTYARPRRHCHQMASESTLVVERDEEIVDNAEAVTFVSYVSDDPMALRLDYMVSSRYFDPHPPTYTVTVARDEIAHALATGTSKNLKDTADLFAIFCSPSHLKGKGKTTFTWRDPYGSGDVHILTVPTRQVLKVLNSSYAIVAPGEELQEPSNNLDSVLDEILAGSTPSKSDED